MTSKKAQLEKHKGKKITGGGFGRSDRFGKGSAQPAGDPDKKKLSGATAGLLKNWIK